MFRFATRRLIVRPWRDDDRPALARMTGDATMMRYVSGATWTDREIDEFLARQQRHLTGHAVCFGAVERATTGEVVGVSGMQPLDSGDFELGWWTWKEHWGRGYAAEATRPFVDRARAMGLAHAWAVIDPDNHASMRVAAKLGMHYARTIAASETISTRGDRLAALYRIEFERGAE